jgi:putative transposase
VESIAPRERVPDPDRTEAIWDSFQRKPASVREEAERRFNALRAVEEMVQSGMKKMDAYTAVAAAERVGEGTLRGWLRLVQREPRGDWLPLLAPKYTGRIAYAEYDERIYQWFRDLYLSQSKPPAMVCYRRVQRIAQEHGLEVPSRSTLTRDLERREDPFVVVLEREGVRAALDKYPYMDRDRSGFRAFEALNMDGHNLDIAVVWPDGERVRATLIGVQDLYSGMIVGWRLAKSESAYEVSLAVLGACDAWGIPERIWVDNTLAMASKRMTAGAPGRRRFKDKEYDPLGVLPQLDVQVHWTTPAHGQAKPIERAFLDLTNTISKHPAFEGAYLGNNPVNKPGNYGKRVVPVEEVQRICEQEILAHNQQPNRRTQVCGGQLSFWEAFQHSYQRQSDQVRRLTESQRRLLYLMSGAVTVRPKDGCVHLFGNRYWSEPLARYAGRKVVVRYHPDELHGKVFAYTLSGDFICEADCLERKGFADKKAAEEHHRAKRQFGKAKKELARARRRLSATEVADLEPEVPDIQPAAAVGDDVVAGVFTAPRALDKMPTVPPRGSAGKREVAQRQVTDSLAPLRGQFDALIRRGKKGE